MIFKKLYLEAGLKNKKEVAKFFKVSVKSVSNWEEKEPPHAVFVCLSLMNSDLSGLGKKWNGYKFTPDYIESPEGDFIQSWEIRALNYVFMAAKLDRGRISNMLKNQKPLKPKTKESKKISLIKIINNKRK